MYCLITIALFIGTVFSLKNSGKDSFKDVHGSTSFSIRANDQNVQLQVVDYKNIGDIYEVFDNGVSLGKTSTPGDSDDFASSPEEALIKEGFSKGIFDLVAGIDHKITIKAMGTKGTAAIRLLENKNRISMRMVKRSEDGNDCWDDDENNGDLDDEDYCDIDTDHTITVYKTTFVDSPENDLEVLTVGVGEADNAVDIDFNGIDYGGIFQSRIAQDTW